MLCTHPPVRKAPRRVNPRNLVTRSTGTRDALYAGVQTQTHSPAQAPALAHILTLRLDTGAALAGSYVHRMPGHPAQYDVGGRFYFTPRDAASALTALTGPN